MHAASDKTLDIQAMIFFDCEIISYERNTTYMQFIQLKVSSSLNMAELNEFDLLLFTN